MYKPSQSSLPLIAQRKAVGKCLQDGETVHLGYYKIATGVIKQTKSGTWVILHETFTGKEKYKFEEYEWVSEKITKFKSLVHDSSNLKATKIKKALNDPKWELKPDLKIINTLKKRKSCP